MHYPRYNPSSDHRPLSDEELDDLDELLAALPTPEAMNIEALDGYLAGLLLSPQALAELPGEAWLPPIWGGDPDRGEPGEPPDPAASGPLPFDAAPFASGKQRKKVVMAVLRHLRSIEVAWERRPEAWEPIFSFADGDDEDTEYADAEDWAAGFLMAVALAPEAWAPLFDGAATAALLAPIVALGAEHSPLADATPAERDAQSRQIPDAILALRALRQKP